MGRLIRTELTRFRVRPVIALLLIVAALSAIGVAALTAWDTRPPSRDEISTAKAQAEIDGNRDDIEADLAKCLEDPTQYLGPGSTQQQCRDTLQAAPKSYLPREPLDLRGTLHGNGIGLTLLVAALLVIAGSVFAGGDFGSGSITNQVMFAPSRTRLWTAKAIAVGTWSLLTSVVVLGGFWLATYLVAVDREIPHGSTIVDDIVWHVIRAVLFCMAAAVGAYALTTVVRSAAVTLGLLFVYSVGGELMLALLPVDRLERWTLGTNVFGWLETRLVYFGGNDPCGISRDCGPHHVSHLEAGLYLLALLLAAVAAGVLTFRRRDL